MVQSTCPPSDSEENNSETKIERNNVETTEEAIVVSQEDVQDSKIATNTSDSPVLVEAEPPQEKDTSLELKLEDLEAEDEEVVYEMEPANVSMANISMEPIDVTEESFEQPSDLVVLTPTKHENQENITVDDEKVSAEIQTAANQVIADSIEGAITEVTSSNETTDINEIADGIQIENIELEEQSAPNKCDDAGPDVIACQSPPADFVISDADTKPEELVVPVIEAPTVLVQSSLQPSDSEESDVEQSAEVTAPTKCEDAGPDVIACQSPPADFIISDDDTKPKELDIPVITAPTVLVQSALQPNDSEESDSDQSEEVTAPNKCDNAGPDVIACQSPPADFVIEDTKDPNESKDVEESKVDEESLKAEEMASEATEDERSTLVIENASDGPAAVDNKSEGQAEEIPNKSTVQPKDSPKPKSTPQKIVSQDQSNLKLLTGQAMNLALSYATFIIKDSSLEHSLENYRFGWSCDIN